MFPRQPKLRPTTAPQETTQPSKERQPPAAAVTQPSWVQARLRPTRESQRQAPEEEAARRTEAAEAVEAAGERTEAAEVVVGRAGTGGRVQAVGRIESAAKVGAEEAVGERTEAVEVVVGRVQAGRTEAGEEEAAEGAAAAVPVGGKELTMTIPVGVNGAAAVPVGGKGPAMAIPVGVDGAVAGEAVVEGAEAAAALAPAAVTAVQRQQQQAPLLTPLPQMAQARLQRPPRPPVPQTVPAARGAAFVNTGGGAASNSSFVNTSGGLSYCDTGREVSSNSSTPSLEAPSVPSHASGPQRTRQHQEDASTAYPLRYSDPPPEIPLPVSTQQQRPVAAAAAPLPPRTARAASVWPPQKKPVPAVSNSLQQHQRPATATAAPLPQRTPGAASVWPPQKKPVSTSLQQHHRPVKSTSAPLPQRTTGTTEAQPTQNKFVPPRTRLAAPAESPVAATAAARVGAYRHSPAVRKIFDLQDLARKASSDDGAKVARVIDMGGVGGLDRKASGPDVNINIANSVDGKPATGKDATIRPRDPDVVIKPRLPTLAKSAPALVHTGVTVHTEDSGAGVVHTKASLHTGAGGVHTEGSGGSGAGVVHTEGWRRGEAASTTDPFPANSQAAGESEPEPTKPETGPKMMKLRSLSSIFGALGGWPGGRSSQAGRNSLSG